MNKIKRWLCSNIHIYVYVLCLLAIAAVAGFDRILVSDFCPINGDWQNYNIVRRLLAGYIPYIDFPPYLGLGVAVLILPFVAINNTFTTSLFATISLLAFVLCC